MAHQRQGQQVNASYGMSTFQFWLDRMVRTVDQFLQDTAPGNDMNVKIFQSVSYLGLKYLDEQLGGFVDVDWDARKKLWILVIAATVP